MLGLPLLPLLLAGCPAHTPEPVPVPVGPPPQPADADALAGWVLAGDPLARRPRMPAEGTTGAGGEIRAALGYALPGWEAEAEAPGTIRVPLLRGARLAELELRQELSVADLRLIAPLLPPVNPPPVPARPVLDWLGAPSLEGMLVVAERQVMLGWLDGPEIDRRAVATLLPDPRFDRLSRSPAGQLILSVEQASPLAEGQSAAALKQLSATIGLALHEAGADSDLQQTAWKAERTRLQTERGISGDPVNELFRQTHTALLAAAADPKAVGGALVAQAALRWREACPDTPCGGLDRIRTLAAARRWGAGPWAAAWEIVAWKDSIDHLEVAWGRASAVYAQDEIVELLVDRLEPRLLLFDAPGPPSVLALTRALGLEGSTDRDSLLTVLKDRLRQMLDAPIPEAPGTDEWAPHLKQIRATLAPRPVP